MNLGKIQGLQHEAQDILTALLSLKEQFQEKLLSAPPGQIHSITRKNNQKQYYVRYDEKDKTGKYMPKKNMLLIKQYAEKSYYEKALKVIEKEIKRFYAFTESDNESTEKLRNLFTKYPLVENPIDIPDELYIQNWLKQPYEKMIYKEEEKKFTTKKGEKVRSKTERYIADLLFELGIPYRYESKVVLATGEVMWPDFVILDVAKRREIIWEHFGMLSEQGYGARTVEKIQLYAKNGFLVGDKLITTTECTGHSISDDEIQSMVKLHILHQK